MHPHGSPPVEDEGRPALDAALARLMHALELTDGRLDDVARRSVPPATTPISASGGNRPRSGKRLD